jgi:hypothetical protein
LDPRQHESRMQRRRQRRKIIGKGLTALSIAKSSGRYRPKFDDIREARRFLPYFMPSSTCLRALTSGSSAGFGEWGVCALQRLAARGLSTRSGERIACALWQEACLQALPIIIMIENAGWSRRAPSALPQPLRSTRARRAAWRAESGQAAFPSCPATAWQQSKRRNRARSKAWHAARGPAAPSTLPCRVEAAAAAPKSDSARGGTPNPVFPATSAASAPTSGQSTAWPEELAGGTPRQYM